MLPVRWSMFVIAFQAIDKMLFPVPEAGVTESQSDVLNTDHEVFEVRLTDVEPAGASTVSRLLPNFKVFGIFSFVQAKKGNP